MYMLYCLRWFFSKALLDASVSCHNYAKIWFQNSIIAIKLYLMILKLCLNLLTLTLNLYLEWSESKSDFVLAVL